MTDQGDMDGFVEDAVDLLSEMRDLQIGFADGPLFGGQARFDGALRMLRDLQVKVEQAKAGYAGYAP
jgi:hypothetical protein